jgi:hypothetical protein
MKKIGDSIKGVVGGFILIVIAVILLWWNEGNNVKNLKTTAEMEKIVIDVGSDAVDKNNEGKLIATHGKLINEETLTDSVFNVSIKTPKLVRKVEMYQWEENVKTEKKDNMGGSTTETKTYTYEKVWSDHEIDSSDFKKTSYSNPPFSIKSEEYYGESLSYIIYPQDRYEFKKGSKITCTNNQVATYESNNFSISSLTNSTKCTLEFTKSTVKKYTIRITNSEDSVIKEKFAITQGTDEMEIEEGSTATLSLSILDGVESIPKLSCDSQIPDVNASNNGYTFTWMGVSKNINCRIVEEAKPIE